MHDSQSFSYAQGDDKGLFGLPLHKLPKNLRFSALVALIFVIYITFFLFQEFIFKSDGFSYGGVQTLIVFLSSTLIAILEQAISTKLFDQDVPFVLLQLFGSVCYQYVAHRVLRRTPQLLEYGKLAFFSVLGVAASGYSLQFLSFPTWVLFKSSRVVFVMFGGIIMLKKRYSPLEYFSVALLAMGLVLFTVVDVAKSPNFHPIGIALVLLALVSDAMLGNIQERIFQRYKSVSKQEMVMYSFGLGSAFIFAWLLAFSRTELMVGSRFLMEHPTIFGASIVNSGLNYVGVIVILEAIKSSSALTTVFVTSVRKAITIVLSFVIFAKPFTVWYILGGLLVFAGLFTNLFASRNSKKATEEKASLESEWSNGHKVHNV